MLNLVFVLIKGIRIGSFLNYKDRFPLIMRLLLCAMYIRVRGFLELLSLLIYFICLALTRTFRSRHNFSMGFRSGDCDGYSRTLIFALFNHLVTTQTLC